MSTLRSALDELRSTEVLALSEEQLASDLDELEHATRVFEVERGRRVAELERRGTYARDGHLSLASWLASRHRVAPSTAAGHVRMARALEAMRGGHRRGAIRTTSSTGTRGGPTALSNLVLLCRRHHRLIHHKRFSVEMVDKLPRFYRADGTVLEAADRAPP
jgi:hypothetical protein